MMADVKRKPGRRKKAAVALRGRRVPVKVWCDPAWGQWLNEFACRMNCSLVGLVMTSLVHLARTREGIEPPASVIEQSDSYSKSGPIPGMERRTLLFFVWPEVRDWVQRLARHRRQWIATMIESALAEYAKDCRVKAPPPRTLTDCRVPRP